MIVTCADMSLRGWNLGIPLIQINYAQKEKYFASLYGKKKVEIAYWKSPSKGCYFCINYY